MQLGRMGISSLAVCGCAVFLLAFAAQAQNPASSPTLYGKWYTYPLGNPNTDPVRHEFRHNSGSGSDEMVVSRVCPAESRVVIAKAVSPIEVSQDTIRVLKSASATEPLPGTSVCQASITAGVLGYSFSEDGDRLVLTEPGGNPDYLELARETEASDAPEAQRLYGTWLLPSVDGKAMRMQIRWVFYTTAERQDKLRQITVCSQGNDSLVSQVYSDISISHDQIKVMQAVSNEQQEGTFSCKASLVAATWRYKMAPSGVTLTLSAPGGKPIALTREPQPGLN